MGICLSELDSGPLLRAIAAEPISERQARPAAFTRMFRLTVGLHGYYATSDGVDFGSSLFFLCPLASGHRQPREPLSVPKGRPSQESPTSDPALCRGQDNKSDRKDSEKIRRANLSENRNR